MCLFFSAARTVQTDAHTASKEEEQTQAQTPSTTGPFTTRYDTPRGRTRTKY